MTNSQQEMPDDVKEKIKESIQEWDSNHALSGDFACEIDYIVRFMLEREKKIIEEQIRKDAEIARKVGWDYEDEAAINAANDITDSIISQLNHD